MSYYLSRVGVRSEETLPIPEEIAVIGGGRWGKIYCRVLSKFAPALKRVYLVSKRNSQNCDEWLTETFGARQQHEGCQFFTMASLEQLVEETDVNVAVIANLPSDHFETARRLLESDFNLLVEKPFTQTSDEANELIELARERNLVLNIGHEYLLASYVYHFRSQLSKRSDDQDFGTKSIKASWQDVAVEPRSGILKRPDVTTSVVNDLFPHIVSQLTALYGVRPVRLKDVSIKDGGWTASLNFHYGELPVDLQLSRCAESTDRSITVETDELTARLDYSKEPGEITVDGNPLPADPNWDSCLRPLNAEVAHLFKQVASNEKSGLQSASASEHILSATREADARVAGLQRQEVRLAIRTGGEPQKHVLDVLRQHLAVGLLNQGLVSSPKDTEAIDELTKHAFLIMREMANRPFTTQKELAEKLPLTQAQHIDLNTVIRSSKFAQSIIMNDGHGSKYIANTIAPIIRSGAIDNALKEAPTYPHRVGVYAGQSCMFFCTFCGRKHGAKYDRESVAPGNEVLKRIFREAPKDDPHRFYLSGGLEPLTNQGIGDIISCGTSEGFKLSLYTNAFMLTPKLVERQPGLWDLNTLRISFYGVDTETTELVTQKKKSFEQVVQNAKTFLAERNRRDSELKLGFNFVMLPGRTEQILQLAEVLAEINQSSDSGRQIDFLTLREDYSVTSDEGISPDERKKLIDIFQRFEERRKQPDLCDLHVDFGYSLQSMREGYEGYSLEMVTPAEMRPQAYPQVSVVVDLLGDVYAYREAGFLNRDGVDRYIMDRIDDTKSFEDIIREFVEDRKTIEPLAGDTDYFDIFDHVVTKLLNQAEADDRFGVPFEKGPIASRSFQTNLKKEASIVQNAHFATTCE